MKCVFITVSLCAMAIGGCTRVLPPCGETRVENEGFVNCGFDDDDEAIRCDVAANEACCVAGGGDSRQCLPDGECGDVENLCDDSTDCAEGQICCGNMNGSRCQDGDDCGGSRVESCVVDWNCPRGQICRENEFVSEIFLCDEP